MSQPVNASLPMISLKSHKRFSQAEISNLNNNSSCSIYSIHSLAVDLTTYKLGKLPMFRRKSQNLFHTLLGVISVVLVFFVIF